MKCDYGQLARQLKGNARAVYVIHGDEPLLIQEAVDHLRHFVRQQDFSERERYDASKADDWQVALASSDNLSLFAERKLIEVHSTHKPDANTGKLLEAWLTHPPSDTVLLITLPKLDANAQKARWFNACDEQGLLINCPSLDSSQQRQWLQQRLHKHKLELDTDALQWLHEQTEGNLLAASQEIIKLQMLYEHSPISREQVQAAISDSSRYSIYGLTDTALMGDASKTARILFGLRAEGEAESLVLWAVNKEIRTLAAIAEARHTGTPLQQLWQQHGVWQKRQPLLQSALQRLSLKQLQLLQSELLQADLAIKGQSSESPWDVLLRLCLALAGVSLFHG